MESQKKSYMSYPVDLSSNSWSYWDFFVWIPKNQMSRYIECQDHWMQPETGTSPGQGDKASSKSPVKGYAKFPRRVLLNIINISPVKQQWPLLMLWYVQLQESDQQHPAKQLLWLNLIMIDVSMQSFIWVAAPCTNLPEGIVLGIVLGWAPIGFLAMATPRPSQYYFGHA